MVTPLQLQYLQLLNLDGLPHSVYSRLIRHTGSMSGLNQAVVRYFEESGADCRQAEELIRSLENPAAFSRKLVRQSIEWLHSAPDRDLICYEDPAYPALLKQIDSPPPLLFVAGDRALLATSQLAIVGSRRASGNGKLVARWLAKELAANGFGITSGLAAGIDSEAHRGALEAGGRTLAIVGTGIDRTYPPGNKALAREISRPGCTDL